MTLDTKNSMGGTLGDDLPHFAAECMEAGSAALKLFQVLKGTDPTPKTEREALNHLLEEMADVLSYIEVLSETLDGVEAVSEIWGHKMTRWKERMAGRNMDNEREAESVIKNLTPHTVTIIDNLGNEIRRIPSDGVAHVTLKTVHDGEVEGIKIIRMEPEKIEGLPDYAEGVLYIVSGVTANAAKAAGRRTDDLLMTAEHVRNLRTGKIIGCRRFARV